MRAIVTLLMVLGLSGLAWADYDEGVEYEVLKKIQPAPTDGKVEVIEFFSYGCPHCYRFEPYIDKWKETKSENIEFIHVPAIFNKNWESLATLYYTAEVLGVQDKMHNVIFEAMHGEGKKLRSFEDLKALFEKNGVSNEALEKAMNSFTVAAKTRRAKTMTEAYGIKSVPNIVVQGKYRTNGTLAESHANVFKVVDYLSEKIEKEAKQ
ncbi:MAG: thiol:disulfide interchange protein DsbA/DsbL [gamma proteobacterium symbiont of Bathyaustriella thionipta]|nr:thiol:disulfide interchange protein DsbA/DsbL [gamma proteobacterium symbiont of Bathyaustriella thionipta]MCU7949024.1 thiol:disulfide interchange protein DsbA/DsbL [gamma proteobacterium symbiont of Bathyaustriella thionipta]MCU7954511.1 thiol:disulfide interchange protein DsbA/DsbL [gamma proteobacterium symbiont of Bathyaustriella thionipta]MCU7955608.1 thiol:disulfide interchange protein DsbA/DsbL [gamma proteobacterium symbiont of Bathyaustriella thionipta]MCU7967195.1 thiol:disulfide 